MLRWFTDFGHIETYVAIKIAIIALLLMMMALALHQPLGMMAEYWVD
jgi:hypothetical protein